MAPSDTTTLHERPDHITRKMGSARLRALVVGLVLALTGLTACGGGDTGGSPNGQTATGVAHSAPAGYYPHDVDTLHGAVTIPSQPKRVVALSPVQGEEALALGVKPVAAAWDPDTFDDFYPWLSDKLGNVANGKIAPNDEVQVEEVAKLKPDLIIGATYQLQDKKLFDQLSDIAPTIVTNSKAVNVDWDKRLTYTADALGARDSAKEQIADIKRNYRQTGSDVRGATDSTYNFAQFDGEQFNIGNASILNLLGLKPADNQDNSQNAKPLSRENTGQLDADLLVVWPLPAQKRKVLDADKAFQRLPAVTNGSVLYATNAQATALNSPGPLGLPWFLKQITPTLKKLEEGGS